MTARYEDLNPRAFENAVSRLIHEEDLSHNDRLAIADYALTELRRRCAQPEDGLMLIDRAKNHPDLKRIIEAHSWIPGDWPLPKAYPGAPHDLPGDHYSQGEKDACYICTLLHLLDAAIDNAKAAEEKQGG